MSARGSVGRVASPRRPRSARGQLGDLPLPDLPLPDLPLPDLPLPDLPLPDLRPSYLRVRSMFAVSGTVAMP